MTKEQKPVGTLGVDAGFAMTGVAFEDKQVWLWQSKPDKKKSAANSDINRLKDFAYWLDDIYATVMGEYPCDKYVLQIEHFAPHSGNMSWNSLKTIQINAIAIGLAAMYDFDVRVVYTQQVHALAGGPTKEDTQKYVFEKFVKIGNDIKANWCKTKWEHPCDAIVIATYPTTAPVDLDKPRKTRRKKK